MSSTLFGRGTNGQVGLRRKTEEVNKSILEIQKEMSGVKLLNQDMNTLRSQIMNVETRNSALEGKLTAIETLLKKINERLEKVETSAVTQSTGTSEND